MFTSLINFVFFVKASSFWVEQYKKRFFQAQSAHSSDRVVSWGSCQNSPGDVIVNPLVTFFFSSLKALIGALDIGKLGNIISKCSFMSEGWIIKGGVVAIKSDLPGSVAGACVGLLRFINRFSQDVQGFNAGTVNQICLSTLAIQGAGALSQSPGLAVTGQ